MTFLRAGAATDTGQVRSNNQDAVLVAEPVFAVADGMGGHVAGEIASQVAVESLQGSRATSRQELVEAVGSANRAVWERAEAEPELRGMGTTLCVVALVPGGADEGDGGARIVVANVGDSRVYQFHDGDLDQITDDHSLVEDLVREGRLSAAEARTHPQRNILTRVLGNEPEVKVDSWEVIPRPGDRYVLCSDGLFNEVDDDRIAAVLRRLADPDDAAHELVVLANQGGGRDNVSVVVVDVVDEGGDRVVGSEPTATTAMASATSPALSASLGGTPPPVPMATPAQTTAAVPTVGARPPDVGAPAPPRRTRRLTWRSALFVFSLLVVVGGAVAAVMWFARSTYYVGVDDEQVAIFRGRPGGLLWIQPTLAERTPLGVEDVPAARREAITAGKEEPSLVEARRYVASLREQAEAERRRTTTTSTTTTSIPDGSSSTTATTTPTLGTRSA
ncbi:MAG TPA: Stp1/IreP family PP2C-type Ser/Thr phosphatase [Acidimicrobiales bacterium]|nr:Stp1/IreP family PP2C-type Ser/Thr phosphatase [Acidimicrobiales bacterium]